MNIKLKDIKPNPNNPRYIKDEKFEKLKQSIQNFPEMLTLKPLVVDEDMILLGGNMRYRALKELGIKEVEVIQANGLTEEQKAEFITERTTPSASDDGYSAFELIMLHENKIQLLDTLLSIKNQYMFEKQEDALMELVRQYKK